MVQIVIVALLVVACTLRAAWVLAPAAARRAVARALLGWPLPVFVAKPLRKHAEAAGAGCACDGCDNASASAQAKTKAAPTVAPITFHRRLPR